MSEVEKMLGFDVANDLCVIRDKILVLIPLLEEKLKELKTLQRVTKPKEATLENLGQRLAILSQDFKLSFIINQLKSASSVLGVDLDE